MINENDKYYEYYGRVAILLENNPGMSEKDAQDQAKIELTERRKNAI